MRSTRRTIDTRTMEIERKNRLTAWEEIIRCSQPIKARKVQIGAIDEEAKNLMENRLKRKPFAALSHKCEPVGKQCRDPAYLKVPRYQREPGATGQLVGRCLKSIDLGLDGIGFWGTMKLPPKCFVGFG